MRSAVDELWEMVQSRDAIDATRLMDTLSRIGRDGDREDERTRLLIKQTREALSKQYGDDFIRFRLGPDVRFTQEDQDQFLDGRGFHRLEMRVQEVTNPETLLRMLRELGERIREPVTLIVGGSLTLMLDALVVRKTSDVDIVDEVPAPIREKPELIDALEVSYGLRLTHFQSHYLPDNWLSRMRSIGQFGRIDARRVDPVDVLVAKLFSKRRRDFNDLLAAFSRVDRENIADRVRYNTKSLRMDAAAVATATEHWYILTGEQTLPG